MKRWWIHDALVQIHDALQGDSTKDLSPSQQEQNVSFTVPDVSPNQNNHDTTGSSLQGCQTSIQSVPKQHFAFTACSHHVSGSEEETFI